MGIYLNPRADAFEAILREKIYVDKSGLISYTNSVLNSSHMLTCFSRPRRFGKSYATKMLAAYYSKGADSASLFQGLEISNTDTYRNYLNKYNVLFLDIAWFISIASNIEKTVTEMQENIIEELKETFPDMIGKSVHSLPVALLQISARTGQKFFIIIDEWDALFREASADEALQKSYIQLLCALFKGVQISQFLAEYVGFTEKKSRIYARQIIWILLKLINGNRKELVKAVQLSDQLLDATLNLDTETVSEISWTNTSGRN